MQKPTRTVPSAWPEFTVRVGGGGMAGRPAPVGGTTQYHGLSRVGGGVGGGGGEVSQVALATIPRID